jgi:hypothetical protein
MRLGGIEFPEGGLGGWTLCNYPANELPQELATAIVTINMNLLGASYTPIRVLGTQVVNGTNYLLLAKIVRTDLEHTTDIVLMVVNIPAGDITGEKATLVDVINQAELPADVQDVFDDAIGALHGVNYTPLLYVGSQVVKGLNYYIICEAQVVYPGAIPTAVIVCVNTFEGKNTVVSIEPVSAFDVNCSKEANAPLGEWP